MEFPKQIKDTVYRLLQEPTLDHFREFLQDQTGEHNAIDFKQEWIEQAGKINARLSKLRRWHCCFWRT